MEQWWIRVEFKDGDYTHTKVNGSQDIIKAYYEGIEGVKYIEFLLKWK